MSSHEKTGEIIKKFCGISRDFYVTRYLTNNFDGVLSNYHVAYSIFSTVFFFDNEIVEAFLITELVASP